MVYLRVAISTSTSFYYLRIMGRFCLFFSLACRSAYSLFALGQDPIAPNSFRLGPDDTFLLNGRSFNVRSGTFHWFRVPEADWQARLLQLRAMGLNTIETYVPWNMWEWEERWVRKEKLNFTKLHVRFLRLVASLGLKAILRPGPYVCAEWRFGGLPDRLARLKSVRSADPQFLAEVDSFWRKLLPEIEGEMWTANRGGAVILVQIENEFGAFGNPLLDRNERVEYLTFLKDLAKEILGKEVTLFTTDPFIGMGLGGLPGEILQAADFGPPGVPLGLDANPEIAKTLLGKLNKDLPLEVPAKSKAVPFFVAELYTGWLGNWGQKQFFHISTKNLVDWIGVKETVARQTFYQTNKFSTLSSNSFHPSPLFHFASDHEVSSTRFLQEEVPFPGGLLGSTPWTSQWSRNFRLPDNRLVQNRVGTEGSFKSLPVLRNWNLYMGAGGSNFGFSSGASEFPGLRPGASSSFDVVTQSYDYGAPIGEDGRYTWDQEMGETKFQALRAAIQSVSGEKNKWPVPEAAAREAFNKVALIGETHAIGEMFPTTVEDLRADSRCREVEDNFVMVENDPRILENNDDGFVMLESTGGGESARNSFAYRFSPFGLNNPYDEIENLSLLRGIPQGKTSNIETLKFEISEVKDRLYIPTQGRVFDRIGLKGETKEAHEVVLESANFVDMILEVIALENFGGGMAADVASKGVKIEGSQPMIWFECGGIMEGRSVSLPEMIAGNSAEKVFSNPVLESRSSFLTLNGGPRFFSGLLHVPFSQEVAGSHIDLSGELFGRGHITVNDRFHATYWSSRGPQQSVFIPASFLQKGLNKISVLELEKKWTTGATLNFAKDPLQNRIT